MEVTTLWYRSPEILTKSRHYHYASDVWAVGCIFGELISGKPLFKGSDEAEQLSLLLEISGKDVKDFELVNSVYIFFIDYWLIFFLV